MKKIKGMRTTFKPGKKVSKSSVHGTGPRSSPASSEFRSRRLTGKNSRQDVMPK